MNDNYFNQYVFVIRTVGVTLLLLAFALIPGTVPIVHANAITVNSKLDTSGNGSICTLRDAILTANDHNQHGGCALGGAGLDNINFNLGFPCLVSICTITLSVPLPTVTEDLNINGGAYFPNISGNTLFRVFDLGGVTVNMSDLHISNGNAPDNGAGINMTGTTLTVTDVTFSNNHAVNHATDRGGAIFNGSGTLNVVNSSFSGNTAANYGGAIAFTGAGPSSITITGSAYSNNSTSGEGGAIGNTGTDLHITASVFDNNSTSFHGGAIFSSGTTNITSTTFSNNKALGATSRGGALYIVGVTSTISNSVLYNNVSFFDGGAIYFFQGTATLTNVTLSGNTAKSQGGAITDGSSTVTANLNNVTITNNTADSDNDGNGNGGGIFRGAGTFNVKNSIIAGNFDTINNAGSVGVIIPDCDGSLTSQGFNLIGNKDGCTGFTNNVNGDKVGTGANPINPLLAALANNGGLTQTHALLSGSPAFNAANPATPGSGGNACAATDQRGIARPAGGSGGRCDMGAFEFLRMLYLPIILK